jgi:N-6 DNA Methylase/TaqI-like C-terminal specificity domain
MVKPTSLKWVDDWYRAIAANFIASELTGLERHQRVQDAILNALYYEVDQQYGIALSKVSRPLIKPPPMPTLTAHTLGEIYEQILSHSPTEKKTSGAYYTPVPLVDFVIENTVKVWTDGLPTVLDPACGGGFFLLAAYQELLDQQGRAASQIPQGSLTYIERERLLLHCIHGVDINPQAVAVTQLSLLLKLWEDQPRSERSLPDLSCNIRCGNAVIGEDFKDDSQSNSLDWQKEFPHILQSGGFNIVIGNPPYIDSEWMTRYLPHWRKYCTQRYKSATGNWDLFCIFIEKALTLCRSDGLISLVVPNKLASAPYAAAARSLLTTASHIMTLQDYSQSAAFEVAVYPLVFVAQKRSIPIIQTDSDATWVIAPTLQQSQLLHRLDTLPKLETIAQVKGAATVAEAYIIQDLIQELIQDGQANDPLRVVNSGTIDRYCFLWGKKPMRYLGQIVTIDRLPPRRLEQARQPKIIVSGMTQRLECAIDRNGSFLAGKSTVIIYASQAYDLRYLLGVLNSRLISFYLTSYFGGNCLKGKYLRIGSPQIRQIPIGLSHDPASMIQLVEQRLAETDLENCDEIDRQIDQLVYQLYGLTDLEIQTIDQAVMAARANGHS